MGKGLQFRAFSFLGHGWMITVFGDRLFPSALTCGQHWTDKSAKIPPRRAWKTSTTRAHITCDQHTFRSPSSTTWCLAERHRLQDASGKGRHNHGTYVILFSPLTSRIPLSYATERISLKVALSFFSLSRWLFISHHTNLATHRTSHNIFSYITFDYGFDVKRPTQKTCSN